MFWDRFLRSRKVSGIDNATIKSFTDLRKLLEENANLMGVKICNNQNSILKNCFIFFFNLNFAVVPIIFLINAFHCRDEFEKLVFNTFMAFAFGLGLINRALIKSNKELILELFGWCEKQKAVENYCALKFDLKNNIAAVEKRCCLISKKIMLSTSKNTFIFSIVYPIISSIILNKYVTWYPLSQQLEDNLNPASFVIVVFHQSFAFIYGNCGSLLGFSCLLPIIFLCHRFEKINECMKVIGEKSTLNPELIKFTVNLENDAYR